MVKTEPYLISVNLFIIIIVIIIVSLVHMKGSAIIFVLRTNLLVSHVVKHLNVKVISRTMQHVMKLFNCQVKSLWMQREPVFWSVKFVDFLL